jgi:hypothetical protein
MESLETGLVTTLDTRTHLLLANVACLAFVLVGEPEKEGREHILASSAF